MVNYFVCSCLFDFALFSNYNVIDEFVKSMKKMNFLKSNILILEHVDSFYIYCKETVQFLTQYYPDFYEKCMEHCPHENPDPESVNCLDLCEFGFEDLCLSCQEVTISYLLKCLIKI